MFSQNNEEPKLDWMYKAPNSLVDREEYLLGRSVDKTLEQINVEEKQKQSTIVLPQPKNHVEHECIPPSIRDYKLQIGEQVDLSTKLQEDPLVAIKKREEETRRQFLQNPVQLKKLQKALKAQASKKIKKKKKHKKDSDSEEDLDRKIKEKLGLLSDDQRKVKKKSKESSLDTILMHKFNELKSKLSDEDLQNIMAGKISDSDDSNDSDKSREDQDDERVKNKRTSKKQHSSDEIRRKSKNDSKYKPEKSSGGSSSEGENSKRKKDKGIKKTNDQRRDDSRYGRHDSGNAYSASRRIRGNSAEKERKRSYDGTNTDRQKEKSRTYDGKRKLGRDERGKVKKLHRSRSSSQEYRARRDKKKIEKKQSSDKSSSSSSSDDSEPKIKKMSFGLIKSDGSKIELKGKHSRELELTKRSKETKPVSKIPEHKREKLTEEEKEKRRREMMQNAKWRDVERAKNVKYYKEKDSKEGTDEFNPDFLRKELLKSANSSTVESRVKANINKIQRGRSDMNTHFSRRN